MPVTSQCTDWKGRLITTLQHNFPGTTAASRFSFVSTSYESRKVGPDNAATFQTTLTLAHRGSDSPQSYVGEPASSKKASERSAAEKAVRALEDDTADDLFGPIFPAPTDTDMSFASPLAERQSQLPGGDNGEPGSSLQRLHETLKRKFDGITASFAYEESGPAHMRVFQATLTLEQVGGESRMRFDGGRMGKKKASEQVAAAKAVRAL